jgi:hypothetical protein
MTGERECSAPGCGHVHDLQCALMSIATGGLRRVGTLRRTAPYGWPGVEILDESFHERPGLWDELQTTLARLSTSARSSSPVGKASETPVPYHARASAVAHRMRNELSTWARVILEERSGLVAPVDDPPAIARWLADRLAGGFVRLEMADGIRSVVRDARQVIDRAPDKVYAGPCLEPLEPLEDETDGDVEPAQCQGQLYATTGKAKVRCHDCGAVHDVEVRQEWLSRTLGDQLVSAAEAAPVLSWLLGKTITGNHIANWKRDGRVEVHDGRWPYRFGDLMVLGREMKTRRRHTDQEVPAVTQPP